MIYVEKMKTSTTNVISCQLKETSLAEMGSLDPSVGMGWILGALAHSTAMSARPGNSFHQTDAVLQCLKLYLPDFTSDDFDNLISCYSMVERVNFLGRLVNLKKNLQPQELKKLLAAMSAHYFTYHRLIDKPDAFNILKNAGPETMMLCPPWINNQASGQHS